MLKRRKQQFKDVFAVQENILSNLLKCEKEDLEILDNVDYKDMDSVIESLKITDSLTLYNLMGIIFSNIVKELKDSFKQNKDEIEKEIKREIQESKKEDDGWKYNSKLEADLELLLSGELEQDEELEWSVKHDDVHFYMKNIEFYTEWMPEELERLENQLGYCIEG